MEDLASHYKNLLAYAAKCINNRSEDTMTINILETKRLILTVPQLSDLDNLIALRTDPEVMCCLGGFGQEFGMGVIQDIDEIKYQLSLTQDYFNTYGLGFFCAFEKESCNFIGQAGLFHLSFNTAQSEIELAYRLHKKYWGKGYATELAIALIDWGLNIYKLEKIIAPVHPGNQRSIRVLQKSGMQCEGTICHKGHNLPCYSISREASYPD
jgi:RimJ/RimL family protein N-acetyltransferase